ncbi:MAG TPA: hypothetical protein VNL16_12630 [Chloroflexota bacterium]|nr:hypothetical protein [Chloroflexota bacterium]
MKSRWLATVGVAVALAVSACSGGTSQTSPSTPTGGSAAAPAAATAPAKPTTAAAKPTVAPTTAPTVAPTVAPSPTTAAQPTVAPTSTVAAQAAASGPAIGQGDLKAMAEAVAAAKSYRVTMSFTDPSDATKTGNMLMEVVRPDRTHMKLDMGAGQSIESITIGQDQYTNLNGKWTKTTTATTASGAGILSADPQQTLKDFDSSNIGGALTKGALSQVDGTPCQEWVYTPTDKTNTGGSICVSVKDSLPLEFKSVDGKSVLKFSDWNAPITINPPL